MSNKILSLMKESSMRKMSILCVIAIFLVFCSISVFAEEQKTKVDPEKWAKLTPEQKETFKKNAEKARDTNLAAAKAHEEVIEKAKEAAGTVARGAVAVTKGAMTGGPKGALKETVKYAVREKAKDRAKKEKEKK